MTDFRKSLEQKLILDFQETPEEAERMIKAYPDITIWGIMNMDKPRALDRAAMMLQMKRDEDLTTET